MNAPATTRPAPMTTTQLLKVLTPEIARAVPKGMDADRLARLVTTEIRKSRNAKLAGIAKQSLEDCTHESFAGALLTASALGLEPGIDGECYLVPYRDNRRRVVECQLIIGYKGIVKLFWQHPRARGIQTEWVGANDHFVHEDGLNPVLVHKKAGGDRGVPIAFWAIVKVADADPLVTVLTADEVKELRRGKVGSSGDIKDPQHWMERKTVLKQALKLAPKTTRLDMAIQSDDRPGTALSRSQAMELPPVVEQTPDYIDGEVDPGPLADDPGPADYPADDPGPAEPAAAVPTEVVMASRKQLGQLKQIRDAEKYDADLEWFGFLSDLLGEQITKASDITGEQADRILATFQTQEN